MRTDIMVDIETLGTGEGATIFQIAAISFDITNGQIKDTFEVIGDIEKYNSLNVDGSTLKWWLNTNKELLSDLLNKGIHDEYKMFEKFYNWITVQSETGDMKDVYLWGNGILFDNAKIQRELNACVGLKYPIFYRNDRDLRTLLELASMKSGLTESELKDLVADKEETLHDAFDDTKYQIRLAHKCYQILVENK
ncbi:3'-5' exoribonuclease [Ureibacillus chungkukjangi]|uniref:3'-5' exonuclease n=1 Tax=Ureibacillus chungkukjangi TaxID=1202712 RepID=UPI002040AD43|nr:3'-5' exonuclease [Ureibacillus chungkukjangi]MCM3387206.1 3'-5' exoribonuclease [Ureibacillus chungkukjangi]